MSWHDEAPRLDLDWEVRIFRGLLNLYHRLRPATAPTSRAEAAHLEREAAALTVVARALAAAPLRVLPAGGVGGLRGGDILVPELFDLGGSAEDNRDALLLRVAVNARMYTAVDGDPPADPGARAVASLDAARRATELLCRELDGFRALHDRIAALDGLSTPVAHRAGPSPWDALRAAALDLDRPWTAPAPPSGPPGPPPRMWGERIPSGAVGGLADAPEPNTAPSSGTERKRRPVDEVERASIDEARAEQKMLQHTFEKVETLDDHAGQEQRMDGSDELDAHLEALDELDLRHMIRGGERAGSLYTAEVGVDADIPDVGEVRPGEQGILYDEWDRRAGRYRPGWCTVYPTPMGAGEPGWAAAVLPERRRLVEELHRRLVIHRTRRAPVRGQRDGEELDLEAVVDDRANRRAGRGGSDRLYIRRLRRERSFATTVLLDVSLSADSWVADRRVLDVAREAALVLGEVAERLGDPLQVLAFASHTRNRCRVWTVRDWHEPWALGRARLGALHPQGYTRLGPALRHATAELARVDADRRLLLLISDGKPTDYDRYEGRYGVADVRQALREAEARGIVSHALAIDAVGRDHLPAMVGAGAWHILPSPDHLPEALTTLYGRFTGR